MTEEIVVRLDCKMSKDIGVCEPCMEGKHYRAKFDTTGAKRSDSVMGASA